MNRSLTVAMRLTTSMAIAGFGFILRVKQKFLSISYVNLTLSVDSENDLVSEGSTSVVY
jgi:hypothetical protein